MQDLKSELPDDNGKCKYGDKEKFIVKFKKITLYKIFHTIPRS